jgi:hypothetical protein
LRHVFPDISTWRNALGARGAVSARRRRWALRTRAKLRFPQAFHGAIVLDEGPDPICVALGRKPMHPRRMQALEWAMLFSDTLSNTVRA